MAIYGDVNGDGIIDIKDAMWSGQAAAGARTLTPEQLKAADLDGDGKVTDNDRLLLANYLANVDIPANIRAKIGQPTNWWGRFLPMMPNEGPPLPRLLNIRWPGRGTSGVRAGLGIETFDGGGYRPS